MRELEKQQKEMEENADRQFSAEISIGIMIRVLINLRVGIIFFNVLILEINPKLPVSRTVSTGVPLAGNNRTVLGSTGSFQSSRRGSEDSADDISGQSMTLRDLRVLYQHEIQIIQISNT